MVLISQFECQIYDLLVVLWADNSYRVKSNDFYRLSKRPCRIVKYFDNKLPCASLMFVSDGQVVKNQRPKQAHISYYAWGESNFGLWFFWIPKTNNPENLLVRTEMKNLVDRSYYGTFPDQTRQLVPHMPHSSTDCKYCSSGANINGYRVVSRDTGNIWQHDLFPHMGGFVTYISA